jgi:hypothetical protein
MIKEINLTTPSGKEIYGKTKQQLKSIMKQISSI